MTVVGSLCCCCPRRVTIVLTVWFLLVVSMHSSNGQALYDPHQPLGNQVATSEWREEQSRRKVQTKDNSVPQSAGDAECPCANVLEPLDHNIHPNVLEIVHPHHEVNLTNYGFGCHPHDANLGVCRCNDDNSCDNNVPSWCHRYWCWVQPLHCNLLFHRAVLSNDTLEKERYYSYASCRDLDTKTPDLWSDDLHGKTLNIGLLHFPVGYRGSFHRDGASFVGPIGDWSGPVVDFVREVARRGGFNLSVASPPAFLRNKSLAFFGVAGGVDLCVYATALGYLDACVGTFLLNNLRTSVTDWMILGHEPIYLITHVPKNRDDLGSHVQTLFTPFTTNCWIFVVCFFIPLMAALFVVHEYGQPGSIFPDRETAFCETNDMLQKKTLLERRVPFYKHLPRAIYCAVLGVMQSIYDQRVVTPGAKLHLLGFMVFELTLVAVYTANLSAILTKKHSNVPVTEIQQVKDRAWRFCAIREVYEVASELYNIRGDFFVSDPTDGLPGFVTYPVGRLLMESIDPALANQDERYCHVALGFEELVRAFHADGFYCDKALAGRPLGTMQYGFPLFAPVSPTLLAIMYRMKNDGWWQRLQRAAAPVDKCPFLRISRAEKEILFGFGVSDLTGIWFVSSGFGIAGLCVSGWMVWRAHKRRSSEKEEAKYKSAVRYDQHGKQIKRRYRHSFAIAAARLFSRNRGDNPHKQPRARRQSSTIVSESDMNQILAITNSC